MTDFQNPAPFGRDNYVKYSGVLSAVILFCIFPIFQVVSPRSAPLFLILSTFNCLITYFIERSPQTRDLKLSPRGLSLTALADLSVWIVCGCFVLWMTISVYWSSLPDEGLKKSLTVFLLIVCVYLNTEILRKIELKKLFIICMIGIMFSSIVLFFEFIKISEFYKITNEYRIFDYNRNVIFIFNFSISIYFIARNIYRSEKKIFVISIFSFAFLSLVIFMSESESTKVSLIIVCICALFLSKFPNAKNLVFIGLAVSIFAMPIAVSFAVKHLNIIEQKTGRSISPRIQIWSTYIANLRHSPVIGHGAGSGKQYAKDGNVKFDVVKRDGSIRTKLTNHGHSSVIQVWHDLGAIGATLASLLFVTLGIRTSKYPTNVAHMIALSAVSLHFSLLAGASFFQGWALGTIAIIAILVITAARLLEVGSSHSQTN